MEVVIKVVVEVVVRETAGCGDNGATNDGMAAVA